MLSLLVYASVNTTEGAARTRPIFGRPLLCRLRFRKVIRTYLETVSELPWDVLSKETYDIRRAQAQLDKDHYGLDKVWHLLESRSKGWPPRLVSVVIIDWMGLDAFVDLIQARGEDVAWWPKVWKGSWRASFC